MKLNRGKTNYKEIILYLLFGVGTTIVNWGTYSIALKFLKFGIFTSNVISWIMATIFAFITNKVWVFGSRSCQIDTLISELVKFVSSRLATGAFEIVAVPALVRGGFDSSLFGVDGFPAKIFVSIIVVVLNYIISKWVIFKDPKGSDRHV